MDEASASIVNALATLVEEGIEKSSQADILKKMGCWQGQGYLFSKLLTVAEMRD